MLVDAIQRRREGYWYLIIMMPFGELFYFFMVKIHDPEMRRIKQLLSFSWRRRPSLDTLRYAFRQTPCLANMVLAASPISSIVWTRVPSRSKITPSISMKSISLASPGLL